VSEAPRVLKILLLVRALLQLWWLAVRLRPTTLHSYLPLTNFLGTVAGWLALVPVVITSRRALGTHQDRLPLWRSLDRLANRLSTLVTVNSHAVAADTVARDGIAPNKLVLIPNGIDFSRFSEPLADRAALRTALGLDTPDGVTPGIVVVGNLIPYKGHADLIDSIAQLKPRDQPARFLLVGEDRGIGTDLAARACARGVADRISFIGSREDVASILAASDGFVLPSHEEGFSNALLEAMAAGLFIVATDVGGNSEALEDGRLGTLVPPRDPAALARAIDLLLDALSDSADTGTARNAEAARTVRERYGIDRMVEAHIVLYRGGGAPTPPP
jgi:glycosyltransferase involved in cell wall biosynthesis